MRSTLRVAHEAKIHVFASTLEPIQGEVIVNTGKESPTPCFSFDLASVLTMKETPRRRMEGVRYSLREVMGLPEHTRPCLPFVT